MCVCDTFEVRNIPNPRRGISTVLSNRILKQGVFMMGRPNPFWVSFLAGRVDSGHQGF